MNADSYVYDSEHIWNFSFLQKLLLLILIVRIFVPPIGVGSGVNLNPDDVLILVLIPLIILTSKKLILDKYIGLCFIIFCLISFSTFRGYSYLSVPFHKYDIYEIIRFLKPMFLLIFINLLNPNDTLKTLDWFFEYTGWFIIFISLVEFFNPGGFGDIIEKLYAMSHHYRNLLKSDFFRRITVTGPDPNIGGAIIALYMGYNMARYTIKKELKIFILFIALFASLLLTASRTIFLCVMFFIFLNLVLNRRINIRTKFMIFFAFALVFLLLLPKFIYIVGAFENFLLFDTSMLERYERWSDAQALFLQAPYFGWGPANAIHTNIVDGEYVFIIRKFGAIGLASILFFMFYQATIAFFQINKSSFDKTAPVSLVCFATLNYFSIWALTMATNNFFFNYQTMLPFIAVTGVYSRFNQLYGRRIHET
ncbi:MAG: hypothetical protein HQK76_13225 [Desulfobacterales bacterium]|nr:hypothetical protein [Desulfobacterales bacterium]